MICKYCRCNLGKTTEVDHICGTKYTKICSCCGHITTRNYPMKGNKNVITKTNIQQTRQ